MSLAPVLYEWTIEPFLKRIKRKIARIVSTEGLSPVLDLCCGTGKQVQFIHLRGMEVFGLDLDMPMLSFARKKHSAAGWICADAGRLPFDKNRFMGIILSYALHEKTAKERDQILIQVKRLLSPGGKVIFLEFENPWNRKSRLGWVVTWLIERAAGGEHYANGRQFLASGGLRSFIQKQGLHEIKSYNIELACSRIVVAACR